MAMALDASGGLRSSSSSSSSSSPLQGGPRCRRSGSYALAIIQWRTGSSSVLPACCGLKMRIPSAVVVPMGGNFAHSPSSVKVLCQQQPAAPPAGAAVSEAGEVNDKTWKQLVLDSDIPVLVDFWAPWCGPCRMIAPLIDELARQYAGRLRCVKINTDESPNTATEYGIRSIPTVMLFKSGQKRDTVIGAVPKATLISTIEKYLDR